MTFFKKNTCVLLLVSMLISFSACSFSTSESYTYKTGEGKIVLPSNAGSQYRTVVSDNLELICSSGLIELYLDKQTYAVVIKETSAGNSWYSLPTENVDSASVLSLNVSKEGTTYNLNSQDNSVAFGKVKYEKKEDGVWVSYTLSEKKDKPDISLSVTVKYTLKDGSLNVDIDCNKLTEDKSVKVETLELLKYFGATKEVQNDDFILVPDGCGAKINTAVASDEKEYNLKVYGEDYAAINEGANPAIVPAFGVKSGTGAFGAIIRSGDALSTISATKAKQGEYNTVGANFAITPTQLVTKKDKQTKTIANESYTGDLSLCYRFLSGSNATYSGVAAVCREQLIRDAVLSTKTVEKTGTYPINITLVGEAKNGIFKKQELTNFEQAQEIIALLKAKGINSLNLCYSGALSGGTDQSNLKNADVSSKLGSNTKLEELYDYMSTQEFGLFFDVNMLTMNSGSRANNITDDKIKIEIDNSLYKYLEPKTTSRNLVKSSEIEENVLSFMKRMQDMPFTGYCINDAGYILYSDFNDKFVTREDMKSLISEQVIYMSTNHKTMAKIGNFYMLKNVDYILDIPMDTAYEQSQDYECVPFVQMILHGMVEYSGKPVNLEDDYTKAFLKSIEYGTMLSLEMSFNDLIATSKDDESNLCYEQWVSEAVSGYKTFEDLFSDIRDARITNHYVAAENLTCTVYNNMTYIYVNYSQQDITYNNLVIKANSYLRVN
ncbi:MAG: hypothetical protein EOM05_01875 [Clostridia bacterium]|nr:hypothetical protein [Clostridia bacterium]